MGGGRQGIQRLRLRTHGPAPCVLFPAPTPKAIDAEKITHSTAHPPPRKRGTKAT